MDKIEFTCIYKTDSKDKTYDIDIFPTHEIKEDFNVIAFVLRTSIV